MYDDYFDIDEDEFYDELFEDLFPEDDPEPSFSDQPWQGDASPLLRAVCN